MIKKIPKNPQTKSVQKISQFICPYCDKCYKFQSGYSRHKAKCIKSPSALSEQGKLKQYNSDMLTLLKRNN